MNCRVVVLVIFAVFFFSCTPADKYQDQFRVISDSVNLYARPTITAEVVKGLEFGTEVHCRDKNPSYAIPKPWVEAKVGELRGFIERKTIVGEDIYKEIQSLSDGAKNTPVQAIGITGKRAPFRLKPDSTSFVIQILKEPTKAFVLERIVVATTVKEKAKKQVWYKVRLEDGLVGFVTRNNLQLTPPTELSIYTTVRTPVTWYKLNEKTDPNTGEKGSDYLVTYSSVNSDVTTDFTRVELYTYDLRSKQYATSLARSGLYGILPIKIISTDNDRKIIEIREHPKMDANKMHTIQYSFPSPIKIVKETVEPSPSLIQQ